MENFIWIFGITDPPLVPKAGREQVRQIIRTLTAVHSYAASDVLLREFFFRLFWETKFSPNFLNGSKLLQSLLTTKNASTKTALPKFAHTATETVLLFHGIAYMI